MSRNSPLTTNANNSVLVVIDIQDKLAKAMHAVLRERVIEQGRKLLTAANTLSIPVIVTEQYPRGLGHTEQALQQHFNDDVSVIEKTCFSCFESDSFKQVIESSQKRQIIITGMEAHICVLQTAIDLQQAGFSVFVVEDAIASRVESNKRNAIERLRQAGVIVSNTESVIFEWLGDAKHTHFKALSHLIV